MRIKLSRKSQKLIGQVLLIVFLVLNIIGYLGAYFLTNFSSPGHWGLTRPYGTNTPANMGLKYVIKRIEINQTEWLESWFIPASSSKGTILMFPGKGGTKATQLLAPTQVFHSLNYDTFLVDFRGVGGSSGNTTTVGVREAKDVAKALSYAQSSHFKPPYILYGVSMGTAAILKAIAEEKVNPDAIILEVPFATLLTATRGRLKSVGIPAFPLAELLVFWGGIQHGFNGFTHNPVTYAKQVKCPTLILYGKFDFHTTVEETKQIGQNLQGSKQLILFPTAGHQLLVTVDKEYWRQSVAKFLEAI